jgi:anti-sigma factor RsiW
MAHLDPELLSAYIDHELPDADMAAVERHLAECDACRAEYEELRALSTLVRGLPVYLPRREVDLGATDTGRSETLAKIVAFSKPLAVAAVILLVAFAGLRLLSTMNEDAGDGDQISFSAVQPTPRGTEPAGGASEVQAAATSGGGAADEAPATDSEAPPLAAMPAMRAETPAVIATVVPEPAPAVHDGESWLPEVVVAAVVVLLAGAAGWYRFVRGPARRRS